MEIEHAYARTNPKYRTAIHEAGRAATVLAIDGQPSAYIWRVGAAGWAGTCVFNSYISRDYLPVVGMAGLLAELMLIRQDMTAQNALAWLSMKTHRTSKADARQMRGMTVEHVQQCLVVLRESWPMVEGIAQQLMVNPVDHDPE
jgi:hypothetical protein